MFTKQNKWVCSEGGPHLVLPRHLAALWHPEEHVSGTANTDAKLFETPYRQVCELALRHNVSRFDVSGAHGLVLGGSEIPMSTWFADGAGRGGDIVIPLEWTHESSAEELAAEVAAISVADFNDERLMIDVGQDGLLLFAAADEAPRWIWSAVEIDLPPGTYSIWSAEKECGSFLLRVYALVPHGGK